MKKISRNKVLKYQVAEVKLLVVATVFIAVTICSLIVNVYLTTTTPQHYLSIYVTTIICHASGMESVANCSSQEDLSSLLPVYYFSNISLALQSLISLATLLTNTNYSNYTSCITTIKKKFT